MMRPTHRHGRLRSIIPFIAAVALGPLAVIAAEEPALESGRDIYRAACASCHGSDGRGAPASLTTLDTAPPDFTDCDFANREPDGDWVGIAYEGGPSRGFSEFMPAFQGTLTVDQAQMAVDHIRTFCTDKRWPRGELNLPRALVTNKAYPEDEAVITTLIDVDDPGAVLNKFVWEQRFGPRSQWEVVVPFGWLETQDTIEDDGSTRWTSSMGDIAFAVKHAFHHNYEKGRIVSIAGEIIVPTGDEELGFGNGTTIFEPFIAYGQILPADFFFQAQVGGELTADKDKAPNAGFARCAFGWTTTSGQFGRAWSPMLELTAGRPFTTNADIQYSAIPQMQVTQNKRQHIMFNLGARIPLNDRDERKTQVIFYLLWDWFDGTLLEGW